MQSSRSISGDKSQANLTYLGNEFTIFPESTSISNAQSRYINSGLSYMAGKNNGSQEYTFGKMGYPSPKNQSMNSLLRAELGSKGSKESEVEKKFSRIQSIQHLLAQELNYTASSTSLRKVNMNNGQDETLDKSTKKLDR